MEKQLREKERTRKYAPIREILAIFGKGAMISSVILAPGTAKALAPLLLQTPDFDAWKHYNPSYLRRSLRQLHKQKHVEIVRENGSEVIKLTRSGKRKILQYSLQTLSIPRPKNWDDLWRVVLYDIPTDKHHTRDLLRQTLLRLGLYPLQESVYLFPYPCFDEIDYLRQYYFLDINVQYLLVKQIEDDVAYRAYFNLG